MSLEDSNRQPLQQQDIDNDTGPEQPTPTIPPQTTEPTSQIATMEVHHHPHVEKKNFKEYLLEFVMIFLAVTMGFFAESYREYSVEKSRSREYAKSLIHDLEKDTAMAQGTVRSTHLLNAKIDSIKSFISGKKFNDISNAQLFAHTHFICLYKPYTWSRATLEEIKGSGSLRYFGDDSIIMRISAYDALTRHLDEDFRGDVERNDRVDQKKNTIVDFSYEKEDSIGYRLNPDSVAKIIFQEIKQKQADLPLLTTNISDIKILLNDYISIKQNLSVRGDIELPMLITQATQLIALLRKEYDLQ